MMGMSDFYFIKHPKIICEKKIINIRQQKCFKAVKYDFLHKNYSFVLDQALSQIYSRVTRKKIM